MKNNLGLIVLVGGLFLFVVLTGCEKGQEAKKGGAQPTEQKATAQTQAEGVQTPVASQPSTSGQVEEAEVSKLTEKEQEEFRGRHPEPSFLSEREALKYLRILVKGSPDTIRWYKEHEKNLPEGRNFWYQEDISSAVMALGFAKNKEGYNLILQVLEKKTNYPRALANAAKAAGFYGDFKNGKWYGDKRAIPYLKNILNNKDPEVRLQAAGSLLGAGEGDIALPVLDDIIKAGMPQSTWAIMYLLSPEEIVQNGEKNVIISHDKLLDERGKDILKKALTYPNDEVKTNAAYSLASIGIEKDTCEKLSLNILEKFKKKRLEDYGYNPKDGVPDSKGKAAQFYKDSRSCNSAIATLRVLKSKKAVQVLTYIRQNNTDWYFVCWADTANNALRSINGGE